eukprot:5153872-Pleurochrysis_carterae.AAC.1
MHTVRSLRLRFSSGTRTRARVHGRRTVHGTHGRQQIHANSFVRKREESVAAAAWQYLITFHHVTKSWLRQLRFLLHCLPRSLLLRDSHHCGRGTHSPRCGVYSGPAD